MRQRERESERKGEADFEVKIGQIKMGGWEDKMLLIIQLFTLE